MDPAYVKALAALQPFIHLANTTKNPSHRFIADLVTRATSAPGTYVFTELLQVPAVQSLRAADTAPEYKAYLTVLELFSWGTIDEYKSKAMPPTLSGWANYSRLFRPTTID
jgi:COP9 signalosome complex subunit 7